MAQIRLHFYQSLNDFITPKFRNTTIIHNIDRKASVKDIIESFNVPHTEVELILVNGIAVNFNYIIQADHYIQIYPITGSRKVVSSVLLRPEQCCPPIFVVDANLGKLVRYLRLLGFDCLYRNDYEDSEIAKIASDQQRTVLTRDRALLQHKIIIYGYFVRSSMPKTQIEEVLRRFNLYSLVKPLTRCTHCNGEVIKADKKKITNRLEPLTRQHYNKFLICSECSHIYWRGSHFMRVVDLIDEFCIKE